MTIPPSARFTVWVPGRPVPQGSMQAMVLHPKVGPSRAAVKYKPNVIEWRRKITTSVFNAMVMKGYERPLFAKPIPLGITLTFLLHRPDSHYLPANRKRDKPEVNPAAPAYPSLVPDLDKLVRAVFDGITDAGVWGDDSQVVWVQATKRWTDGGHNEGVEIMLGAIK